MNWPCQTIAGQEHRALGIGAFWRVVASVEHVSTPRCFVLGDLLLRRHGGGHRNRRRDRANNHQFLTKYWGGTGPLYVDLRPRVGFDTFLDELIFRFPLHLLIHGGLSVQPFPLSNLLKARYLALSTTKITLKAPVLRAGIRFNTFSKEPQ